MLFLCIVLVICTHDYLIAAIVMVKAVYMYVYDVMTGMLRRHVYVFCFQRLCTEMKSTCTSGSEICSKHTQTTRTE